MEEEAVYVKESLARLVVELAQKTWPQHWHTFLEDMDLLTRHGPAQVEVVLLVFRRLAEDLHPQSNAPLSPQRRKEMSAALRDQLGVVYQFIMRNLEVPEAPALCGVALSSLTYYVEWLDWSDLLASDCKLLRLLYSFISVEQLKTDACECLLAILSRKGDLKRTLKQREKLLILLSKDALQVILDAALKAAGCGVDEVQYVFIKRVCQVLVELGTSQIARLWVGPPIYMSVHNQVSRPRQTQPHNDTLDNSLFPIAVLGEIRTPQDTALQASALPAEVPGQLSRNSS
jgi:hypothetical protein